MFNSEHGVWSLRKLYYFHKCFSSTLTRLWVLSCYKFTINNNMI